MTSTDYHDLSLADKQAALEDAEYVSTREYYNQKIDQYALYSFFVEVWHAPLDSTVEDIKIVSDDKTLDHYTYDRSSFSASMSVIIAGSRNFNDYEKMRQVCDHMLSRQDSVAICLNQSI